MRDRARGIEFQTFVTEERLRQEVKWGTSHDALHREAYLIALGEEFGELCRAHIEGKGFETELVQVAAVCQRIYETFK